MKRVAAPLRNVAQKKISLFVEVFGTWREDSKRPFVQLGDAKNTAEGGDSGGSQMDWLLLPAPLQPVQPTFHTLEPFQNPVQLITGLRCFVVSLTFLLLLK